MANVTVLGNPGTTGGNDTVDTIPVGAAGISGSTNIGLTDITLLTSPGKPVIKAPTTQQKLLQGHKTAVHGVSLSEAHSLRGEIFTVTLSAQQGLLSATGTGVKGSNTKTLTITGTLAQVNAALATLSETDNVASPGGTFDQIVITAKDSLGNQATSKIGVKAYSLKPAIKAPTTQRILLQGHDTAIPGVSLSEANAVANERFTVTLSAQEGVLSATGAGVKGSNTKILTVAGTLARVNAALATLHETDDVASAGGTFDLVTVTAKDAFGNTATAKIGVTAYALQPVVAAPPLVQILLQGHDTAIPGVSLSEAGALANETFTVVLSAEEGVLSATGTGIAGSGTKNLSVTGTLAQVNAALATLHETDDVASTGGTFDLISIAAKDSFGNQATNQIGLVAYSLTPVLATPPLEQIMLQGTKTAIHGVSLSEADAVPNETFTVTLSAEEGVLSATGTGVAGSGTATLSVTGTLAQVNARLATLHETDDVASPGGTFELITVAAKDGFGNKATSAFINGIAYSLSPVLTVPTAQQVLLQGHNTAIHGVSLSEAGAVPNETFTVTLSAEEGVLSATGTGVAGSGTAILSVAGTLAQVNAALATLHETDDVAAPSGIFELITVAAQDGFGNQATTAFINGIAYSLTPVLTVPPAEQIMLQGHGTAIHGVGLSEANAVPNETFTVVLSAEEGVLSATGTGVAGSGTQTLSVTGTLAQVNAALATLHETDDVAAPSGIFELITVGAQDGFGNKATSFINGIAYSLTPELTVPAAEAMIVGSTRAIAGVAVSEANTVPNESFSVAFSDQNGLLSATGTGVTGSGTTDLSITGTLAQVNAALATLADTDHVAGFDTISIVAKDGFGNAATGSIGVNAVHLVLGFAVAAPVTINNGDNTITSSNPGESITFGNGNNVITLSGAQVTITAGDGDNTVAATGGGGNITLGSGTNIVTLGGTGNTVSLGAGADTVNGASGDTITINASHLTLAGGKDESVFVASGPAAITDLSSGTTLSVGRASGSVTFNDLFQDAGALVDLTGSLGGYTTVGEVIAALAPDGHGGTLLALGATQSIDFIDTSQSVLTASHFRIS